MKKSLFGLGFLIWFFFEDILFRLWNEEANRENERITKVRWIISSMKNEKSLEICSKNWFSARLIVEFVLLLNVEDITTQV